MERSCCQLSRLRQHSDHISSSVQVCLSSHFLARMKPRLIRILEFCTPSLRSLLSSFVCSGGVTNDIRSALAFISHFSPDSALYGIGFSLGANQICKYAGEEGEASSLKGVISLGTPFDFIKGNVALNSSWLRLIYSRAMGANLKRLVKRHSYVLEKHPALDWDALYGNPNTTL